MSWQKLLLNPLLCLIEKRQMANAQGPSSLRRAFDFKVKILFQALRQSCWRFRRTANAPWHVRLDRLATQQYLGDVRPRFLQLRGFCQPL